MKTEILATIKTTLTEILNIDIDSIQINSALRDDLGLDSMSTLTFLMALEDKIKDFVIDANTLEMEHMQTVNSIAEYVLQQINKNNSN